MKCQAEAPCPIYTWLSAATGNFLQFLKKNMEKQLIIQTYIICTFVTNFVNQYCNKLQDGVPEVKGQLTVLFFSSYFFYGIGKIWGRPKCIFTQSQQYLQWCRELIRNNLWTTHCSVFTKWAVRSFATVNPRKVSTSKSSFSFSSHIICLLSDGSFNNKTEWGEQTVEILEERPRNNLTIETKKYKN